MVPAFISGSRGGGIAVIKGDDGWFYNIRTRGRKEGERGVPMTALILAVSRHWNQNPASFDKGRSHLEQEITGVHHDPSK